MKKLSSNYMQSNTISKNAKIKHKMIQDINVDYKVDLQMDFKMQKKKNAVLNRYNF